MSRLSCGQDKVADDIEDAVVGERVAAASISSGDTSPNMIISSKPTPFVVSAFICEPLFRGRFVQQNGFMHNGLFEKRELSDDAHLCAAIDAVEDNLRRGVVWAEQAGEIVDFVRAGGGDDQGCAAVFDSGAMDWA